jgi:hypothetical protein
MPHPDAYSLWLSKSGRWDDLLQACRLTFSCHSLMVRRRIGGDESRGDPDARGAAEDLVNYLGTRGHLDFRDLLDEPAGCSR